jgi:hypothetical protein
MHVIVEVLRKHISYSFKATVAKIYLKCNIHMTSHELQLTFSQFLLKIWIAPSLPVKINTVPDKQCSTNTRCNAYSCLRNHGHTQVYIYCSGISTSTTSAINHFHDQLECGHSTDSLNSWSCRHTPSQQTTAQTIYVIDIVEIDFKYELRTAF